MLNTIKILQNNEVWQIIILMFIISANALFMLLLFCKCALKLRRYIRRWEKKKRIRVTLITVLVLAIVLSVTYTAKSYADPNSFSHYEIEKIKHNLVQDIVIWESRPRMSPSSPLISHMAERMPPEVIDDLTRIPDFSDVTEGQVMRCSNGEYYLIFEGDGRLHGGRITRRFGSYCVRNYHIGVSLNNSQNVVTGGGGYYTSDFLLWQIGATPHVLMGKIMNPDIVKLEYYDRDGNLMDVFWADPAPRPLYAPQEERKPYFVLNIGNNSEWYLDAVLVGYDKTGMVVMSQAC